jgi:murein DD-endopeptidase MepM/ murein hydrolase activator NlpD
VRSSILVVASVLSVTAVLPAGAQLKLFPLDIRVPAAPTPFLADGKTHLAYELRMTNLARDQVTLTGLEVFADSSTTPLLTETADDLKASARLSGVPGPDPRALPSGRQTLVYLWVTVPAGNQAPTRLRHRITITSSDSAGKTRADTVTRFVVSVATRPALVLSAPFTGGPWVAINGPSNVSGHRRTAVPLDGEARIAQRFATDWIKLGPDGLAFHGDSSVNANWYGHGAEVIAVADAKVVATKDGIIENVPFSPTMAVPITLETVGGNHVILDLCVGRYAFYAHLQQGSLKVRVGDRVRRGQSIGLLGNTGNSTAPHLHFHVTDGNSPLGSEGLPFLFDRFEFLGQPKSGPEELLKGWHSSTAPVTRTREGALENFVIRFP